MRVQLITAHSRFRFIWFGWRITMGQRHFQSPTLVTSLFPNGREREPCSFCKC